ncbi:tudor domain-containing 6-like [Diretmus argenteus]
MDRDRLDRLTDGDFTKAEDFIRLIRVLYTCTLCVSTEKSPTAGQILPIIQKLEKHFAAVNGDTAFVADLKKKIWGNLSTRYKNEDIRFFLEEATALDPRFKNKMDNNTAVWERIKGKLLANSEQSAAVHDHAEEGGVTQGEGNQEGVETESEEEEENPPPSKQSKKSPLEELFAEEDAVKRISQSQERLMSMEERAEKEIQTNRNGESESESESLKSKRCPTLPLSFYVQFVREEEDLFSIVEKLNDGQSTRKTIDIKDVHPGDLVQAEFPEDSSWYRAVVREIHGNAMALVEFVDFGNTAMISLSKMCRLSKPLLKFPTYSTHCMLSEAAALGKEVVLDPEVVSTFKKDIGNGDKELTCRFIRQSGSVWEVSLEDSGMKVVCKVPTRGPTAFSEIISEKLQQVKEKPDHSTTSSQMLPNKSTLCHLKPDFIEGQQLEAYVTAIGGAQTFWCQLANSEELDKLTLSVSEVGNAAQHKPVDATSLSHGSPCIALYADDELWYRAQVISKNGDVLSILFVDYGDRAQVNVRDVREMPPELIETPPQAFLCELEGFDASHGSWDDGAVDALSDLIADKLLQLTVLRVTRGESHIKCVVQVVLDDYDTQMIVNPDGVFETLSDPEQCGDDDRTDYGKTSSHMESEEDAATEEDVEGDVALQEEVLCAPTHKTRHVKLKQWRVSSQSTQPPLRMR